MSKSDDKFAWLTARWCKVVQGGASKWALEVQGPKAKGQALKSRMFDALSLDPT